jgi:hypothetical protein
MNLVSTSQVVTRLKPGQAAEQRKDSLGGSRVTPDADRDDIPFFDYLPGIIWTGKDDTVQDYCYIRKNFTDQMISVWNYPRRYYPASRVYAAMIDGAYYRSVCTSPQNYVFAKKVVSGPMNLYVYRSIPQTNGWVEVFSTDPRGSGYRNQMIIERQGMRGSWEIFGYFISAGSDTGELIRVQESAMKDFADTYLAGTPGARAEALKFDSQKSVRSRKTTLLMLMTASLVGTVLVNSQAKWLFLAGFPAAILVAQLNKPKKLHWEDMVRIVEMHNRELLGQ